LPRRTPVVREEPAPPEVSRSRQGSIIPPGIPAACAGSRTRVPGQAAECPLRRGLSRIGGVACLASASA
jgi:hypothetical protein